MVKYHVMDIDIDGRINNIKMYVINITQDCELDLEIISDVLPEVNSKEFLRL
jgi:hypothetical protein